jgi:hypothetical protein
VRPWLGSAVLACSIHSFLGGGDKQPVELLAAKTGYPGSVADGQMDGMTLLAHSGHWSERPCRLSGNFGLMHRNKIRPIRHLVTAAEHRMRYHRIDRDRGFESHRQACRRLVERRFLAGEAEPSRAVSARLTVIARRTVTCCHTTNVGSCRRNGSGI